MKKFILLTLITFLINGCRYVDTQERYPSAQEAKKLIIPENLDAPNSSSTLEIPEARSEDGVITKDILSPPDMPIRKRQTEDGKVRIENRKGVPVLIVKNNKEAMWKAMTKITLENWSQTASNQEECSIVLHYNDTDAREREKANIVKKLFTRDKYYTDYTGDFLLSCSQRGSIIEAKFTQKNGAIAKSFLADNVMNELYNQFAQ